MTSKYRSIITLLVNIDRWLLNYIFNRERVFTIALDQCVDEFGNSFGKNGDHFFIHALKSGEDFNSLSNFLIKYYSNNQIRSFNEEIGHNIGANEGEQYFCPWEANRVRPLKKFNGSHKVGPTDKNAIARIVTRLVKILSSIKKRNIPPWMLIDGCPRVIKIINKKNVARYIVRDGNHRLSVQSYLGIKSVKVCFEEDHWTPSSFYCWVYKVIKKQKYSINQDLIKIVSVKEVDSWPHVKSGLVASNDALNFFNNRFDN